MREPEPPPAPVSRPASRPASTVEAARPPAAPAWRKLISARILYAALVALGACLLVAAAVLILGGKASFANLALGVIGVLAMTPGVYGLLGPPRPPA